MGLFDIFKKKVYYFDKNIQPQCSYCQFGRRTKDGRGILCEKQGLMGETDSCKKFVYAPLKRVPTKQLNNEGLLADDEDIYVTISDEEIQALDLPEMPDEMKAPDVPDALKAPELPHALKDSELMDILQETEEKSDEPDTASAEGIEIPQMEDSETLPELPEIPEAVPEVPEVPDVPDHPE